MICFLAFSIFIFVILIFNILKIVEFDSLLFFINFRPSTFAQAAKLRRMAAAKEKELLKSIQLYWSSYIYIYIYFFWHSFLDIQSKILWVIKICSCTIWWVFFGFCLEHMRKSMINNVGELYITVGINLEFSFQGYGVTFWRMTLWTPYDGWDKRRE